MFEFSLSECLLIMDELKLLLFSDSMIFSDSSRMEHDSLGCSDTMLGTMSYFLELSLTMFISVCVVCTLSLVD